MAEAEKIISDDAPANQVTIETIARVYLRDPDLARRSGYHTAYCGTGNRLNADGSDPEMFSLTFYMGVARNVPVNVYRRFRDAGVATTERPKRRYELEDEHARG